MLDDFLTMLHLLRGGYFLTQVLPIWVFAALSGAIAWRWWRWW